MSKEALNKLLTIIEDESGVFGDCKDDPDEDSIGWYGDQTPMPTTFGLIRRAREELNNIK